MNKNNNYIQKLISYIESDKLAIVKGGEMEEFESVASNIFGNKYGVSTSSGTTAIYASLFAITQDTKKNEVIVPAYGFHGIVSAICAYGLKPIFCDIDKKTFSIDPNRCKELINENTLAILALQPWGNLTNMDELSKLRDENQLFLLSDSSHAHEAEWEGQKIGGFFDINFASFGMGKLISGGELGIATTDDPILRDRMILFGHTNRAPKDLITESYATISNAVGVKLRPHLFALLLALADYEENTEERKEIVSAFAQFKQNISNQTTKIRFVESYEKAKRVYWKPLIIFEDEINTEELISILQSNGVAAEKHNYRKPLNENTIFTEFYKLNSEKTFPIASSVASTPIVQVSSKEFTNKEKVGILTETILNYVNNRNK